MYFMAKEAKDHICAVSTHFFCEFIFYDLSISVLFL